MMTLLIVDDSELIRSSLLGLLQGIQGIEDVRTAASLGHAMESVRRYSPTWIILDVHLPDGNAIQIIPDIKLLAPAAQIAMFTNDASAFNRDKCAQAGADWFFDKSTQCEEMLAMIQKQAALNSLTPTTQGRPS